jgi:PEP-CTERM motif
MAQGVAMKFKRCFAIAGFAVCCCAAAAPQPGDVVFSDNFDTVALGSNQTSLLGGWTITGGTIDVIGAPGFDPQPGHGHYIDLQGSAGQPGRLSIEIPVEVSGTYLVSFDIAGHPPGNAGAIRIDTGPALGTDGSFTIIGVSAETPFLRFDHGTGVHDQGSFLALTFSTPAFVDTPDGRVVPDTGLLLDNISVTFTQAIPEPATFALVLVGMAAIAIAASGKRRSTPTVT